jgi:hypothetical protein
MDRQNSLTVGKAYCLVHGENLGYWIQNIKTRSGLIKMTLMCGLLLLLLLLSSSSSSNSLLLSFSWEIFTYPGI